MRYNELQPGHHMIKSDFYLVTKDIVQFAVIALSMVEVLSIRFSQLVSQEAQRLNILDLRYHQIISDLHCRSDNFSLDSHSSLC